MAQQVDFKTYTLDEWKGAPLYDLTFYEDFIVAELSIALRKLVESGVRWQGYWLAIRFKEGIITTPATSTGISQEHRYWKITQMVLGETNA